MALGQPKRKVQKKSEVQELVKTVKVLPISPSLDKYAEEKARFRKAGMLINDFDLLIGRTALANDMILVTNTTKHFTRLLNIKLEWCMHCSFCPFRTKGTPASSKVLLK